MGAAARHRTGPLKQHDLQCRAKAALGQSGHYYPLLRHYYLIISYDYLIMTIITSVITSCITC